MVGVLSTLRNNFSPLGLPNFRLYLTGQAISLVGTWLQATAQAWVVWQLSKSEAALGLVTLFNMLPILVIGPWAGVLADRVNRRKLLMATQTGAMLLAFSLALLVQTGAVQLWHIYVLSFLLGIIGTIDTPTQLAFLGDLSGMAEVRKAMNMNAMVLQAGRMVGPALAGFLVARLGTAPAFWLNGLSFLAVIACLSLVSSSQVRAAASGVHPLRQMVEALQFLRTQPRIQDLFLFASLLAILLWSVIFNLLPSVADRVLGGGAETLGALTAASGAGALFGVLLIVPLLMTRRRSGVVLALSLAWSGAWLLVFAVSAWLPLSMLSMFMTVIASPIIFTTALGLTQLYAPANMRARLVSLFHMLSFGLHPIAALVVGYLAEHLGVRTAIQINSAALLLGALWMLSRPNLRRWIAAAKPESHPAAVAGD
jgi:MFS family permease